MGRLLVHLHLHYQDQTDFFLGLLSNITIPYELVVTLTDDNPEVCDEILTRKPDARILHTHNCGYDVYPFFQAMKEYDLSRFDYILKLHTKNRNGNLTVNHLHYQGYGFRNNLVWPLLGSPKNFSRALDTIAASPQVGMVCSRYFLLKKEAHQNCKNTMKLCGEYGIPYQDDVPFCAGTMFLCRSEIVRFLLKNDYTPNDYGNQTHTGNTGTLAHSMETMFGIVCRHLGYEIKGVKGSCTNYSRVFFWKLLFHKDIRWIRSH